jgi:hypothetical protein
MMILENRVLRRIFWIKREGNNNRRLDKIAQHGTSKFVLMVRYYYISEVNKMR